MSIQSSSTTTKSAIVAATMLAIEAEGHGILNGYWGPKEEHGGWSDNTPLSRNQKFSQFDFEGKKTEYPSQGTMVYAYVNGAENRMDGSLTKCDGGWETKTWTTGGDSGDKFATGQCWPAEQICKNVWADTVASFPVGAPALGGDDNWFGCPYDGDQMSGDTSMGDITSGCCGGFQYMTNGTGVAGDETEHPIVEGGKPGFSGWIEGGDPVLDADGNALVTQCMAANGYNAMKDKYSFPGAPNGIADMDFWRNRSNFHAEQVWEEGQIVDLSWISTANHGGMYEYGIVCGDVSETYENFSKNRLTFVADDDSGFYAGVDVTTKQPANNFVRLDGSETMPAGLKAVNGGKEILSNDNQWAFCPAPKKGDVPTANENNFTMRNKLRLPAGVYGDKCTLGWFWWGMVSAGTFVSCADIKITQKNTDAALRSASSSNTQVEPENL